MDNEMNTTENLIMSILSFVQSVLYLLVVVYFWGSPRAWWLFILFLSIIVVQRLSQKYFQNYVTMMAIVIIQLITSYFVIALSGHVESPFYPMYYLPMITSVATNVEKMKKRSISLIILLATIFTSLHIGLMDTSTLSHWFQGAVYSVSYGVLGFGVLLHHNHLKQTLIASKTDQLTGLLNKTAGESALLEEMKKAKEEDYSVSVGFCDLDNFKIVNDKYGHLCGDRLLIKTASIIKESVPSNIPIVRWGGEEFLLIFTGMDTTEAVKMMEKLRSNIEASHFSYRHEVIPVTISGGVVDVSDFDFNILDVLDEADKRLYHAKNTGRNRIISSKLT